MSEVPATGWQITEDDRQTLRDLIGTVRGAADLARETAELLAIADVWDALECILAGSPVEVDTRLRIGLRRGTDYFGKEVFASIRANDESIALEQTRTLCDSGVDSAREGEVRAYLTPSGDFNGYEVDEWRGLFDRLTKATGAYLDCFRDRR